MASAANPVDDYYALILHNESAEDHILSFDEYFESTKEYGLLLSLHNAVPPILVSFNCIGSAFTVARYTS